MGDLERVYRAEFGALLRTATAYLGDLDAAKDAVQDGVANAIRNRGSYRGEGTLEAWLWKVVLNAVRSEHRARAHTPISADASLEAVAAAVSTNGYGSAEAVGR